MLKFAMREQQLASVSVLRQGSGLTCNSERSEESGVFAGICKSPDPALGRNDAAKALVRANKPDAPKRVYLPSDESTC